LGGEAIHERGSGLRAWIERLHGKRRLAGSLWVALGQPRGQVGPPAGPRAQDEHEAVLLHGLDEDLDAGQLDPSKPFGQLQIDFGRDPAGAPVGDLPRAVDRAEVPARGDVAGAQVELDAERLEDAAPDLIVERIVAEEPEVAGPAARRDARRDVADEAAGGLGGEQGEI